MQLGRVDPCSAANWATVFSSRSNSCTTWALKAALYCFLVCMALSLSYSPLPVVQFSDSTIFVLVVGIMR